MLVGKALKTFLFNILVIERNKLFISPSTISLFVWETRLGKGSFQIEVLILVQNITENRLRHARGPVHYIESVTSIAQVSYTLTVANS